MDVITILSNLIPTALDAGLVFSGRTSGGLIQGYEVGWQKLDNHHCAVCSIGVPREHEMASTLFYDYLLEHVSFEIVYLLRRLFPAARREGAGGIHFRRQRRSERLKVNLL